MCKHLRLTGLLIVVAASVNANAANLCTRGEFTVFAFATKAKKMLSLCRGPKNSYLVYRFGAPGKIELQFPRKLDASSWQQFAFEGRQRGGGKENAGFYDYSLSFSNGRAKYHIYQIERSEEDSYTIGVEITAGDKPVDIKGVIKTQQGALSYLEETVDKLPNGIHR